MSMISSQRDTLFVMADALEEEYPSFAREVRRVADTIWELRNKLAGVIDQNERIAALEDENARLRSCLSDDTENARQIMGENAKLLGLVYDMWNDMNVYYVQHERPDSSDMDFYRDRMRELRIEVPHD